MKTPQPPQDPYKKIGVFVTVFAAVRGPRRARRGGLPRARDGTGRQNVVRPRPSISRTAVIRKDDKPHDLRHIPVGDGRGRRKTAENNGKQRETTENSGRRHGTAGDGGGRWGTVLHSDEWGKLQKRPDGTTGCRPSSSLIFTCRATLENDRTGRQTAVRPRPGSGRTDCPVANTGS